VGVAGVASAAVGLALGLHRDFREQTRPIGKALTISDLDGTDTDASPAIQALLASGGAQVILRGDYVLGSEIIVPPNVSQLVLAPGSVLRVRGNHPALTRAGTITFREMTGQMMPSGTTRLPVHTASAYTAGEYLLVSGADVVAGSPDRYGYLRQVTAVDPEESEIEVDSPLPRSITRSPRTSLVELAPVLEISGTGRILSEDPQGMYSPLIHFFAADHPHVTGVTVSDSGAAGVTLSHCLGGVVECTVSDLLDDGTSHFGYGVNVTGSTRDARVQGTISRVRHAVTTNAGGLIAGVGYAGEPENCYFSPDAHDCSNKSVDTHRLGWGITIVPRVTGGGGGVQVRSDNARVVGGSIQGCDGPGVFVSSVVRVATSIDQVKVEGLRKGQVGILCKGPAAIVEPMVTLAGGTGIELNDDSSVDGGRIDGPADLGLKILGSRNTVAGLVVGNDVRNKVVEAKPSEDNRLSLGSD
jgi:hypothetical protein